MTRDEIIRRLEKISSHAVHVVGEKPFIMSLDDGIAVSEALELLKEQEAVEPTFKQDKNGIFVWACGSCGAYMYHIYEGIDKANKYAKYCRQCGRKVKWND